MNKKAFEIQFNWIFVLVAGAVILLFFVLLINKQRALAETSTQAAVLGDFDKVVTSLSLKSGEKLDSIPKFDLRIDCGKISVGTQAIRYQNLILFAPSLIKGDKIIVQTMDFNLPFKIVSIPNIASLKMRYLLVSNGNSALANNVNSLLSQNLNKQIVSSASSVVNQNNYKVKFAFFGAVENVPASLAKMNDEDVTAISINANANEEKGTVTFYQKKGSGWNPLSSYPYIGMASLISAIYTDKPEIYKCGMENEFTRMNLVAKVYLGKANKLMIAADANSKTECKTMYENALASIDILKSSNFNSNIDNAYHASKELAIENDNAKKYSCIPLY